MDRNLASRLAERGNLASLEKGPDRLDNASGGLLFLQLERLVGVDSLHDAKDELKNS